MRELTLAANRANATIFTVDPRGLSGVVDAGQRLDQSEWRTYIQKTQSSLRYLAEETGGFAVVNSNDFATAFKRIDAETSDYYVIGLLLDQSGSEKTRAAAGSEGRSAQHQRHVAHRVLAQDSRDTAGAAAGPREEKAVAAGASSFQLSVQSSC